MGKNVMPTLLSTRQESPNVMPEVMPEMMLMDPGSLVQAFEAFTSTADSLQNSYGILQTEVGRLRQELELRNRDLAHSLAENDRMRARLGHILENLPCGVMTLTPGLALRYANDIARRLLASASAADESAGPIPDSLRHLLGQIIS